MDKTYESRLDRDKLHLCEDDDNSEMEDVEDWPEEESRETALNPKTLALKPPKP